MDNARPDIAAEPTAPSNATPRYLWPLRAVLFVVLWATFAFFQTTLPGWNVNTRLSLTYAIVELGTVEITRYQRLPQMDTDDVAVFDGKVYSDKVIGTSLLGVPAFALVRGVENILDTRFTYDTRRAVTTALSVAPAGALAGVLLFDLLLLISGASIIGTLVIAIGTMLGSGLLLYSTLFMAYAPGVACLLAMWLIVEHWRVRATNADVSTSPPWGRAGFFAGLALLMDFTFGLAVVGVGLLLVYYAATITPTRADARVTTLRNCAGIWRGVLLGLVALAPFLIYTYSIFGRFAIPYEFERNELFREMMARGFMGATWPPNLTVLQLITVHPFRGLFVHTPLLIAGLAGAIAILARGRPMPRAVGAMLLIVTALYLLFNACYYMWWGGWSFSPRILLPAVPMLAVAAGVLWRGRISAGVIIALAIIGIAMHIPVVAVNSQPRDITPDISREMLLAPTPQHSFPSPWPERIWPKFRAGEWSPNLGTALGLPPLASWIPLAILWALAIAAFVFLLRTTRPRDEPHAPRS